MHIVLLTRPSCPLCMKAKDRLRDYGLVCGEQPLDDRVRQRLLSAVAGATTAPQMFVDGGLIGGSEATEQWLRRLQRKSA